jgi:hypothetical protein
MYDSCFLYLLYLALAILCVARYAPACTRSDVPPVFALVLAAAAAAAAAVANVAVAVVATAASSSTTGRNIGLTQVATITITAVATAIATVVAVVSAIVSEGLLIAGILTISPGVLRSRVPPRVVPIQIQR